MDAPTLTAGDGPRLVTLRPHRLEDADDVLALCRDEQMQQWTTVPVPYEREHAESFLRGRAAEWERDGDCTLAIDAVDDEGRTRFAGNIALRPADPPGTGGLAEVGFALAPWARERGIMTTALRRMLEWGFADTSQGGLGLSVVHWQAHVGNWASRRVAWACGFRVEGTVRGLLAQRGVRHDGWIASIVRGDDLSPATPWLEAPQLHGEHVVLRPWREDDVPRVAEACQDAVTQRWLPQLPSPYTVSDAQWYVRSREELHASGAGISWCVADPDDDRCLGSVAIMRLAGPVPDPEIGYWAHPEARGRGVTTEATRLAARHALLPDDVGGLGLERLLLRAASANTASNTVAQRAGFTQFGTAHRGEQLRDGTVMDFVLYELLATEGFR